MFLQQITHLPSHLLCRPKVLVTLCNDDGKLMNSISSVQTEGTIDVLGSLQLAMVGFSLFLFFFKVDQLSHT